MNLKTLGAAALLAACLNAGPVLAQGAPANPSTTVATRPLTAADLADLRAALRASSKQTVAQNLRLTPDEATRFWPIYDQYTAELVKINDGLYGLIAEYANTYGKYDDKAATSFITRWLDVDTRTAALRAKYVPIVGKVLPGIKATTFFQIDRRMAMAIDLKIASELPILQAQARQ